MNAAQRLAQTLVDAGIEVCFTAPELQLAAALETVAGMRRVPALSEAVASGAADGYARIAGTPAATLLRLGPGFSNALANIHNARMAHVPMVNVVAGEATCRPQHDAPLNADIEGMAAAVSHWAHTCADPALIAADAARAVRIARHGQIATLVLPASACRSDDSHAAAPPLEHAGPPLVAAEQIEVAASTLRSGRPAMILVGGPHISAGLGLKLARISAATGARVCVEAFPTRITRGAGSARLERLPCLAEQAIAHLAAIEQLVLIGAQTPRSLFANPEAAGMLPGAHCQVLQLAQAGNDLEHCVDALVAATGAPDRAPACFPDEPPALPGGALDAAAVAHSIASQLPPQAIVVDDGASAALDLYPATAGSAAHDWLALTGGSTGCGLPCAVGAAIAAPQRQVVCLAGGGSTLYTIQALWTMAREQLDVTVVVCNSRRHSPPGRECAGTSARGDTPGPQAAALPDSGGPDMDFVALATGMGVAASRAGSAAAFNTQFAAAIARPGPHLIEAVLTPAEPG